MKRFHEKSAAEDDMQSVTKVLEIVIEVSTTVDRTSSTPTRATLVTRSCPSCPTSRKSSGDDEPC